MIKYLLEVIIIKSHLSQTVVALQSLISSYYKRKPIMIPHEIFAARPQPELQTKSFHPSEEELEFAKQSLIEKSRISNGIQQVLFCKKEETELLYPNEKTLETERKKYVEFIKRNYNQKLSDELFNFGKLRQRIKEFEDKQRDEAAKDDEEIYAKKAPTKPTVKRGKETTNPKAGKKKLKAEEPVEAPPKGKKGAKKQAEKAVVEQKQVQVEVQEEAQPSLSDSLELNLINSLSQDHYEGDYE